MKILLFHKKQISENIKKYDKNKKNNKINNKSKNKLILYNFFMTIYIEIFLLQNILINFCLIKLIQTTTKNKTNFYKMLLSSVFGAVFSVFSISFLNNNLILNLIKLTTAIIMILLAFKQTKKQFIYNTILLFLYTYAFGGFITNINTQTYHTSFGIVTTSKYSLELICILILISSYIFDLVLKHIKLKISTNNLIYAITLTQGSKTLKVNAYLDTGNFLNHHGQPVLILDLDSYLKLTNKNLIDFYTSRMETIKTGTVNGNNSLKIFNVDKIEIFNKKTKIQLENQFVAINTTNCFKNTNYQALLSPLFL